MSGSIALMLSAVGYTSAVYLMYRACVAWLRVRWARHGYPRVPVREAAGEWHERCRGALLGLAIGDAVNLPAESVPGWLIRLRYPGGPKMRRGVLRFVRRAGDVSDDTQLAICVSRSIGVDGIYRHGRFVEELRCWSYFRTGAGGASSKSAVRARRTGRARGENGEGNGVAVRVAPLAIAAALRDRQALLAWVEENGRATHENERAIRAGVFIALVVREALLLPIGAFEDVATVRSVLLAASGAAKIDLRLRACDQAHTDATLLARLRELGTSGHVTQCIPAATLVLMHHRLDFAAAMRSIFFAGGDTDSIGAMVGAVIGAQVGAGGLPGQWAGAVQHGDYLCWLADRLAAPRRPIARRGQVACVRGDIATMHVDVVINAWNRNVVPPWLLVPQGVSKAIRAAGGEHAIRAVGRRAPLPLGSATETLGGAMPCTWIVHAAGIDLLWRASETSVRDATRSALSLCRWLDARTVALPLIGAGSGGLAGDVVEAVITDELRRHAEWFDLLVLVRFP